MDISHNHHHISPLAVVALVAGAGLFAAVHGGYLKHAFHKEILASIDPATVITATDMASRLPERRAVLPRQDKAIASAR
ncbi:hypothetical protein RHSP_51652 [Rhizobium freirei PRF 81]|uniref:Transmembrane protein n=1 Tax=Rhizobium freirei PRF 81 TaxID=363754 RepID=N6V7U1_9HYPH|nr:hypothetical protein [Rhizobium freirei]ENN89251.1 hypothetical protein RHSP_51652 [Rhizobium freirei PRF 81]